MRRRNIVIAASGVAAVGLATTLVAALPGRSAPPKPMPSGSPRACRRRSPANRVSAQPGARRDDRQPGPGPAADRAHRCQRRLRPSGGRRAEPDPRSGAARPVGDAPTRDFRCLWFAGALWVSCPVSVFESLSVVPGDDVGARFLPAAGMARGSTVRGPAWRGGSSFPACPAWLRLTRSWARIR